MDWALQKATRKQRLFVRGLLFQMGIDEDLPRDLRKVEAAFLIRRLERRLAGRSRVAYRRAGLDTRLSRERAQQVGLACDGSQASDVRGSRWTGVRRATLRLVVNRG